MKVKCSFADEVQKALHRAGISDGHLVSQTPESPAFGDTGAVFNVGPFLLRFVRDRGQIFVDLSSHAKPAQFHQFDDVIVAMGWRTIAEVLARSEPEPVDAVLQQVKAHWHDLKRAFAGAHEQMTRARVQRTAHERSQAFVASLQKRP